MSIWKFRLYLIPQEAILRRYEIMPTSIPKDLAEQYSWWAEVQPPPGFECRFEPTLPTKESWSKSLRIWGWDIGGDVQIWYADESQNAVEEIQFRIDSRKVVHDLIRLMCDTSKELNCVLLTTECEILLPVESRVMAAFNASTAAKFVIDPASALQERDGPERRLNMKPPRKQ